MSDGSDHRKILRDVLHAVSGISLQQRVAILRMAQQLMIQKMHDAEQWHEGKQNADLSEIPGLATPPRHQGAADRRAANTSATQGGA